MIEEATAATCRSCGARGRETPGDPAPGICPTCLEHRVQLAMARLRYLSGILGREAALDAFERHLVERVEMTPAAALAMRLALEGL